MAQTPRQDVKKVKVNVELLRELLYAYVSEFEGVPSHANVCRECRDVLRRLEVDFPEEKVT